MKTKYFLMLFAFLAFSFNSVFGQAANTPCDLQNQYGAWQSYSAPFSMGGCYFVVNYSVSASGYEISIESVYSLTPNCEFSLQDASNMAFINAALMQIRRDARAGNSLKPIITYFKSACFEIHIEPNPIEVSLRLRALEGGEGILGLSPEGQEIVRKYGTFNPTTNIWKFPVFSTWSGCPTFECCKTEYSYKYDPINIQLVSVDLVSATDPYSLCQGACRPSCLDVLKHWVNPELRQLLELTGAPNPVTNSLIIDFSKIPEGSLFKIVVVALNGAIVLQDEQISNGSSYTLNTSTLISGSYVAYIYLNGVIVAVIHFNK